MFDFNEDDDNEEYGLNQRAAQILKNNLSSNDEDEESEDDTAHSEEIWSEAVTRMEQANLYKLLIGTSIFGEGSADAKIIKLVDKEVKQFALSRLEELLGIRSKKEEVIAIASNPFSSEEVSALKVLAGKILGKDVSITPVEAPRKPELNTIQAPVKAINKVQGTAIPKTAASKPMKKTEVETPSKKTKGKRQVAGKTTPSGIKPIGAVNAQQEMMVAQGQATGATVKSDYKSGKQAAQNIMSDVVSRIKGMNMIAVDNSDPSDSI